MSITETDIALIKSKYQSRKLRLDLYDTDYVKLGEMTGKPTSVTVNISATSDIRRTSSLVMQLESGTELATGLGAVWLNRLVMMYVGIKTPSMETYAWYQVGSFLIANSSYKFNRTTHELTLSLVDMMAAATSARGSKIGGAPSQIPYGTNVRSALIATIAGFSPFKRYNVCEFPDTIPYDLDFNVGIYPYEILKTILALFPTYEMFYSVDGVFTVQPIPTGIGDPVVLDETVIDALMTSDGESRNNTYEGVFNSTEIFGATIDAGYYASTCTTNEDTYELFIDDSFEALEANSTYMFTPNTTSILGQKINVQTLGSYTVYNQSGDGTYAALTAGDIEANVPYVVKYVLDGETRRFVLLGEADIHVICKLVKIEPSAEAKAQDKTDNNCRNIVYIVNPDSPFAIGNIDEIRNVLQDGEYADINTTQLANERAAYENWKTTRVVDTVGFSTILIPFLDVNQKISYHSPVTALLSPDSIYMDADGNILTTNADLAQQISFDIVDGQLVATTNGGDLVSQITFSINEDGDLVAEYEDGLTTCLTQEISMDINSSTMQINGQQFYSYYPF